MEILSGNQTSPWNLGPMETVTVLLAITPLILAVSGTVLGIRTLLSAWMAADP